MRWTRFMNKENGLLLVPRLVCLYAIIAFEGGTAGRPGGLGTHPRVLGRCTPAVEKCVSTNINGSKARYRILNLMKRPVYTSADCTTPEVLWSPGECRSVCGLGVLCAATCRLATGKK